jgi:hypothetical protein
LLAIGFVAFGSRRGSQKVTLEQVIAQSGVPILASIPWIPLGNVGPNSQLPDRDSDRSST